MKRASTFVIFVIAACSSSPQRREQAGPADGRLRAFAETFFAAHAAFRPSWAAGLGLHELDGKLPDRSPEAIAAEVTRLRAAADELDAISPTELGRTARVEREVLRFEVRENLFELDVLRAPFRNPMYGMGALSLSAYISRDYAPLADRARAVVAIARGARAYLAQLRANLPAAMPRTWIDTALIQTRGGKQFVEEDVRAALAASGAPEVGPALDEMVAALEEHRVWLEARLPEATDDWALGAETFLRMLYETQGVEIDLGRLRRVAAEDLLRNLNAMEEAARAIDPQRSTREVVLAEADDKPADVFASARAQSDEMRRFLIDHEIVTIPSEEVAEPRETPAFMRWNLAFLDSPGVFEPKPLPSFYYISPPDPSWPEEEQQNYLMPIGDLLYVTIHEVWPGHFLHGLHIRKNESKILKTFCTYSMSEGWAHYTEEMMYDEGAGERNPKMRIGMLKEALLRNVRFSAAIELHAGDMTVDDAQAMFEEKGYADRGNARQQAVRGTFDPMYVSYTLGKLMILKLREDWRRKHPRGTLREFHDELLSYACAPLPVIRREMLGDASSPL
jgi:hypothetical protein